MTWDEITQLLTELGEQYDVKVHVVKRDGLDTVALHLPPVAWFVSMKFVGSLNMGVYEGDEHRLVGTEQIPLVELTAEFVRERVETSRGKSARTRARSCRRAGFLHASPRATLTGHRARPLSGHRPGAVIDGLPSAVASCVCHGV